MGFFYETETDIWAGLGGLGSLFICFVTIFSRALYMGELRKNTTSTGTITKKNQVTLEILRLLAPKKNFI